MSFRSLVAAGLITLGAVLPAEGASGGVEEWENQQSPALPLVHSPTPASGAAAPRGDTLTLAAAYAAARAGSPRLAAAAAGADAAAARVPGAGRPPDPSLQVGAMNLSLPGLRADMPSSMAPSIQAMQMLPIPGKLGLASRAAAGEARAARADADEAWWEVRAGVAMAFYDVYAADRQIAVMERTLRLLGDFRQVAQAMYATGTGRQSDVLRADVDVAKMRADLVRMRAMRVSAAARLNGLLDRPAEMPIPAVALPALPDELPSADTLLAWADAGRPMLERGRAAIDQAQAREALARREIWPDLTVGVQYGQRAGEMGTERMGGAMVGFTLPVFARSRQLRMRDEAAAMERMATADLADMRAGVRARIAALAADLDRDRTLIRLYRAEILPQAATGVQSALSSYRVGAVDFMTLADAQMTENTYEQELYALQGRYGAAVAELEMTIGRELPATGRPLAEAP
ncbi:MAG TPA: TolC family protein [Longimicrobiales bacterium]|nr:TolC family protein [Longimicrobiales bacterium]